MKISQFLHCDTAAEKSFLPKWWTDILYFFPYPPHITSTPSKIYSYCRRQCCSKACKSFWGQSNKWPCFCSPLLMPFQTYLVRDCFTSPSSNVERSDFFFSWDTKKLCFGKKNLCYFWNTQFWKRLRILEPNLLSDGNNDRVFVMLIV